MSFGKESTRLWSSTRKHALNCPRSFESLALTDRSWLEDIPMVSKLQKRLGLSKSAKVWSKLIKFTTAEFTHVSNLFPLVSNRVWYELALRTLKCLWADFPTLPIVIITDEILDGNICLGMGQLAMSNARERSRTQWWKSWNSSRPSSLRIEQISAGLIGWIVVTSAQTVNFVPLMA